MKFKRIAAIIVVLLICGLFSCAPSTAYKDEPGPQPGPAGGGGDCPTGTLGLKTIVVNKIASQQGPAFVQDHAFCPPDYTLTGGSCTADSHLPVNSWANPPTNYYCSAKSDEPVLIRIHTRAICAQVTCK